MAKQLNTSEKVLAELNKISGEDVWRPMVGVHLLYATDVSSTNITPRSEGMVVKAFINTKTAEIKLFVAKWLDVPETKDLP